LVQRSLEASVANNTIYSSYGNGIELGNAFQASDVNNNEPYLSNNVIHNLGTAYQDGLHNGIDMNHARTGTAINNNIYSVLAACMTLEADTGPSSGWTVENNTFNASSDLSYNGTPPTKTSVATPFYIRNTSLAGGITMSNNTLVMNTITPWILWGATSPQDTTHDMTLAAFESAYPSFGTQ
jgi:Right handed beta helix region